MFYGEKDQNKRFTCTCTGVPAGTGTNAFLACVMLHGHGFPRASGCFLGWQPQCSSSSRGDQQPELH